jgi:hypothetical protein
MRADDYILMVMSVWFGTILTTLVAYISPFTIEFNLVIMTIAYICAMFGEVLFFE